MKAWYEELAGLWNMLQKKSESKYKNTIYHKLREKSWHRISRKLNKSLTRLLAPLTLEILSGAKPCSEATWSHTFLGNRITKMYILGFFSPFPTIITWGTSGVAFIMFFSHGHLTIFYKTKFSNFFCWAFWGHFNWPMIFGSSLTSGIQPRPLLLSFRHTNQGVTWTFQVTTVIRRISIQLVIYSSRSDYRTPVFSLQKSTYRCCLSLP